MITGSSRGVRCLLAVIAGWFVLLVVFVPLPLTMPFAPANVLTLEGGGFVGVVGGVERDGSGLNVSSMNPDEGALQVRPLDSVDAQRFPVLRYRFQDFPRTLELVLVFRSSGQRDVVAVTIPTPGRGGGTVDLTASPEWSGQISEIGFAQYPGAQSVPPALAFRPFRLVEAELWSPSWTGAIAARWHDWFGARSWALMSLSAIGPDAAVPRGPSLVLAIFVGAAAAVLLGAALLGWRGHRLARMAMTATLVAWLLLDLRWLHGLYSRHAVTRAVYASLAPQQRQVQVPDQALFDSALKLREVLADEPTETRVLVDAGSDFERARLLYHLLPLNVAPVNMLGFDAALSQQGAIVVLYATTTPVFDAAASTLALDRQTYPASALLDDGPLRVYRLTRAGS